MMTSINTNIYFWGQSRKMFSESDLKWQQKLIDLKASSNLTFQQLASRLKCQTSNLIRIHNGTLKMPLATRARLADLSLLRTTRDICLSILDRETADKISARHDAFIQKSLAHKFRPLSNDSLDALSQGNEYPAWNEILDELKEKRGSDQLVADMICTTRAVIGYARRSERRLPFEAKLKALDKTAFLVNDDLLLSLMSSPAISAIQEIQSNRSNSDQHET